MKNVKENLRIAILNTNPRGAWSKGVKEYALMILERMEDETIDKAENLKELNKVLLNGADNWTQSSEGGSYLIYDEDIAETLCNNTELKRTKHGEKAPNKNETWLDVQARALFQAANMIRAAWVKLQ